MCTVSDITEGYDKQRPLDENKTLTQTLLKVPKPNPKGNLTLNLNHKLRNGSA